jgi:hypothetical protein
LNETTKQIKRKEETTMSTRQSTAVFLSCSILTATRTARLGAVTFTLLASSAFGQISYGYFTNAGSAPDAQLSIVNVGSTGGTSPGGDLCANIYVFDTKQEMEACCSCKVPANALTIFSLNTNLTANPLNPPLPNGVIEVAASPVPTNTGCNAGAFPFAFGGLGAWITHVVQPGSGAFSVSELPLSPVAPASPAASAGISSGSAELSHLQSLCSFIQSEGGSFGICTCPAPSIQ